MIGSLQYIDFSNKQYLSDCIVISFLTNGGFSKEILDKLTYDDFKFSLNEAIEVNKEIYKNG